MASVKILKETPQNFTDSWVDYGGEIGTDGYAAIGLWLNIDINDTKDVRFRALAKHISGGEGYLLPIKTETPSVVYVGDEQHEVTADVDARKVVSFGLDGIVPFVQIQIQAGTVGATAGQILDSKYTI